MTFKLGMLTVLLAFGARGQHFDAASVPIAPPPVRAMVTGNASVVSFR